jgi:hypothetical protein
MNDDNPRIIVIGEYTPPLRLDHKQRKRPPVGRWPSRVASISGTVLLHVLITSPLILGVGAQKKRYTAADETWTTSWASRGEPSESMILLDLSAMASSDSNDSPAPSGPEERAAPVDELGLKLAAFAVTPPPDIQIEDDAGEDDETAEAAGDPEGKIQLFGKYLGHITSRIERTWVRPSVPIDGGRFDCSARVLQDRQGNVLAVSLRDCSANEAWRRSLTAAILQASPLSVPPDPLPFVETLTLNFGAEQHEPAMPSAAASPVSEYIPASADPTTATESVVSDGEGDIELSIVGDKVIWSTKSRDATSGE